MDQSIESVLKKTPQYTRLRRHISTIFQHSTPKKLLNLIAIEIQRKLRKKTVIGYPYLLIIDPGNICNLKCPLCPTGINTQDRSKKFIQFEDLKKIIDRFYPYTYEVTLHNWGEPFLNPDILKMIRYCSDKNIGTNLSSNLSLPQIDCEGIINSGLEYMVISLDGTTQNIYSKYRVKGNIDLVYKNLRQLIKKKREINSKTPFIEWQFIVMKHNYHQIKDAQKIAKEIGVNLLRFIPVGLPFDADNKKELAQQWFPSPHTEEGYIEERFLQKPIKGGCFYLYRSVTINPVDAVTPCCAVWKKQDDFGHMADKDFSQIWNNELYQSARLLFSKKNNKIIDNVVCNRCNLFAKPKI